MKITDPKVLIAIAALFMTASAQALEPEVLYVFQAANSESPANANGANPQAALVLGSDRNFYGATLAGPTPITTRPSMRRRMARCPGKSATTATPAVPIDGIIDYVDIHPPSAANFYRTTTP